MHEFKPGDLALVVGYHNSPLLLGNVVTLGDRGQCGVPFQRPDGLGMVTINRTGFFWSATGESVSALGFGQAWVLIDEKHLMPLRGDFATERQKSQKVPA